MKTRTLFSLGAFMAIGVVPATTQQLTGVPSSLSLADAVGIALENNPTYRQASNDRYPQEWRARNASGQLFLPSLDASTTFSYSGTGSQRFLIQDFSQPSATIGSSYRLGLNWSFNGTSLMAPGLENAALDATLASISATEMTVRNGVVQQYLAVLEAEAQVDLQRRQVSRNEENLRLAQARYAVGQTTVIDLRQAEVAKGRADVGLLQAEQLVTVEKLRLFQQMGMPAPTDLETTTLTDTFPVVQPDWELDQLLALADVENPDVNSLRAQERSAVKNHSATRSQWLPTLSFNAGWSGYTQQFTNSDFLVTQAQASSTAQQANCASANVINQAIGLPPQDCTAFVLDTSDEAAIRAGNSGFPFSFRRQPFGASVTVSLPVFDRFNRNVQIAQASAQRDDAREALRGRQLQVRTEVSQQHYAVAAAFQTISIQESNRGAAQEQLRLAQERYRVGSGTFFELLDAQLVAQQAEADYITALYSYHRAIANLEAAVGRPLR
jgi:outer membrane protein